MLSQGSLGGWGHGEPSKWGLNGNPLWGGCMENPAGVDEGFPAQRSLGGIPAGKMKGEGHSNSPKQR